MGNFRKISDEESLKCLRVYRNTGDISAYDMLVICNMWRVRKIAKEFLGLGLPITDLISAGNLGLIEAINTCDLESITENSFGTYMDITIKNYMTNELQRFGQSKWVNSLSSTIGFTDAEKASLVTSGILFEDEVEPSSKLHM